jgi:hypothetical protein
MLRSTRTIGGLLALGILLATSGQVSAQGVELAWKFKPGETLHYVMIQDMSQDMKSGTMPVKVDTKLTMDVSWAVKAVDAQGIATVNQTIDRVRMKMDMAQGMKVEYDSASNKEPEGLGKTVSTVFKAMINKTMTAKMNAQGKILDLKLSPEMLAEMEKSPLLKPMEKMLSAEGMEGLTGMGALPKEPMQPGKTWTGETALDNPVVGKQKIKSTYTYVGPKTVDGRSLEEVDAVVMMDFVGDSNRPAKVSIKEQDTKGTVYFDNAAGHVGQAKTTSKLKFTIDVAGQSIETSMTSTMRFELAPPAQNAGKSQK